jgi:hypothetical protein
MEFNKHEEYSKIRLLEIANRVKSIPELKDNFLCIYTTGSYGRLEASENSDLDLFFLDSNENKPINNIDKTLINAEVIKICRNMKFPEFSKDGGYLTIHNIGDIKNQLGSPSDDYHNFFTARMLLLLESKPIYNEELHISCLKQIINPYYVDFHDHSQSFKPIFLTNDIIRFWKTLCLNYEHKRKRKNLEDDIINKNVTHSKNLKLQFSRKLTCFSFILQLVSLNKTINENDLLQIAKLTPIERIKKLKSDFSGIEQKVQKVLDLYQWFLGKTQIPSKKMLEWLSDKNLRNEAFDKSREFGLDLFDVLQTVDKQKLLNKLLI